MYNQIRLGYKKDRVPAEATAQLDFMPREKCQSLIVLCYIYEIPGTEFRVYRGGIQVGVFQRLGASSNSEKLLHGFPLRALKTLRTRSGWLYGTQCL